MSNLEKEIKTVMIVGLGDLSTHVLNDLLLGAGPLRIVLAGRNTETIGRDANLAMYMTSKINGFPQIEVTRMDLYDTDTAAETISTFAPDIIFNGTSLQSWRIITELPHHIFDALDQAQFGPWLPMHLTLTQLLMKAVKESGAAPVVVNAAFPDAVNPTLDKVGLAPDIGIGNVANIIPALKYSIARESGTGVESVSIKLVAQHYFSHFVPRYGYANDEHYHLTIRVNDRVVDTIRHSAVFTNLTRSLKRTGGRKGQILTAASAFQVLNAIVTDSGAAMHAPGPNGLPGGYPVRVNSQGATVDIDEGLSLHEAISINETCQRADGIERIEKDGTVHFSQPEMDIMKKMLGYECTHMKPGDSAGWADELGSKYREFAKRYTPGHR